MEFQVERELLLEQMQKVLSLTNKRWLRLQGFLFFAYKDEITLTCSDHGHESMETKFFVKTENKGCFVAAVPAYVLFSFLKKSKEKLLYITCTLDLQCIVFDGHTSIRLKMEDPRPLMAQRFIHSLFGRRQKFLQYSLKQMTDYISFVVENTDIWRANPNKMKLYDK